MATDRTDDTLRLRETLASIAPGTPLRDGLERILRGRTGALIVIGRDRTVDAISTGGFELDVPFTATGLRELAKMDGAIIVDANLNRIIRAAVHLMPDHTIPSEETGTRHRTADRVAKQTGFPVISVSQSMQIIAAYVGETRYVLEDSGSILSRANQALATLERYKLRLDEVSSTLSALEIEDLVTVRDVAGLYIYDNTLLGVRVTGADIRAYLEYSARYFKQVSGTGPFTVDQLTNAVTTTAPNGTPDYNFDSVAGLDAPLVYDIDVSKPVGSRITTLTYDGAYTRIPFPNGDIPRERGACTDILIRAYRDAFGIDLQALVNADMTADFAAYPQQWGLSAPDPNIDHRRVPNLATWLERHRARLPIPTNPADWRPGDIFTCRVNQNGTHIGLVSDRAGSRSGRRIRPLHIARSE